MWLIQAGDPSWDNAIPLWGLFKVKMRKESLFPLVISSGSMSQINPGLCFCFCCCFWHMEKIIWGKENDRKIWEGEHPTNEVWVLHFRSRGQVHICFFSRWVIWANKFPIVHLTGSLGDSVTWNRKHRDWYITLIRQQLNKKKMKRSLPLVSLNPNTQMWLSPSFCFFQISLLS